MEKPGAGEGLGMLNELKDVLAAGSGELKESEQLQAGHWLSPTLT